MAEAKVIRAERRLLNITRRAGVSDDGYNWLETAIDPFHDKFVPLKGYPDTVSASSVVQLIKQSINIQCPAGITTGTWDCHIASLPWVATGQPTATMQAAGIARDASGFITGGITLPGSNTTTGVPYNGLIALSGATGVALDVSAQTSASLTAGQLTLPNTYWNDSARVIGLGYEVHNTTAELTVQGGCTVYRLPCNPYTNNSASTVFQSGVSGATAVPAAWSTVSTPSIPSSEAQALLLYGSKTWLAKDGCYMVNTFNSTEIAPNCSNTVQPLVYLNTPNDATQYVQAPVIPGVTPAVLTPRSLFWSNSNVAGSYFTGLSLSTTLKINYNIDIERFPSPNGNDLAVMATPSPAYDPIALEMYSRTCRELPVGAPVAENGFGDWFSGVVNTIGDTISSVSKFAAPILSVITQTKALGMGMSVFNDVKESMSRAPQAPPISQELRARIASPSAWSNGAVFEGKDAPRAPKMKAKQAKKVVFNNKKVKKDMRILAQDVKHARSNLKRR